MSGYRHLYYLLLLVHYAAGGAVLNSDTDSGLDTSDIGVATRDGPWTLIVPDTGCLWSKGQNPPHMEVDSKSKKCTKFFGAEALGGRVRFRLFDQDKKWVAQWNPDKAKWSVAEEKKWEKTQLLEQQGVSSKWCTWYDKSVCLEIYPMGNAPTFTTTTTTTTKYTRRRRRTPTPAPVPCPDECTPPQCNSGSPVNGGVNLTADGNGGEKCTKYCSQYYGPKRYCGEGPDYTTEGNIDCSVCKTPPAAAPEPTRRRRRRGSRRRSGASVSSGGRRRRRRRRRRRPKAPLADIMPIDMQ